MKDIKLPEATAEEKPKENIVILVSGTRIVIRGKEVADAKSAIRNKSSVIPDLAQALENEIKRRTNLRTPEKKVKKSGITIIGDKKIPYVLLKKIMLTCASSDFTDISLAIAQKAPSAEGGES